MSKTYARYAQQHITHTTTNIIFNEKGEGAKLYEGYTPTMAPTSPQSKNLPLVLYMPDAQSKPSAIQPPVSIRKHTWQMIQGTLSMLQNQRHNKREAYWEKWSRSSVLNYVWYHGSIQTSTLHYSTNDSINNHNGAGFYQKPEIKFCRYYNHTR